jgi:hypothetical protein
MHDPHTLSLWREEIVRVGETLEDLDHDFERDGEWKPLATIRPVFFE